ncbi:glucokinase [Rhizobium binae]|uniref:glucokinase n=1 Tax=Rhizobium binae TaxID=1138190 RepID=UPI001C838541|nr:glucokinase [Rhizobium binae]MBX4963439.1 hypothetical protein [Rhizobium binae]
MSILSDRIAIVGEIGPTHSRFAVADIDETTMDHYVVLRTDDFDTIELIIDAYLDSLPHRPGRLSLAVAGDVVDGQARLFHRPWNFKAKQLQGAFSLQSVNLMRDIEAVSLSVPLLAQHDLLPICGTASAQTGPKAIALVERDIEAAVAIPNARSWTTVCGRAGDISFGAEDEEELLIINSLRSGQTRIGLRSLLTSIGFAALHDALRIRAGLNLSGWNVHQIVEASELDEPDPYARQTLQRFVTWLGRFAGDLAAVYGATGGVYLVGGLANDLRGVLTEGAFAASFKAAGGPSGFTSTASVHLVTASNTSLRGAALALS